MHSEFLEVERRSAPRPTSQLEIRPAQIADAAEIARLSGELGYPTSVSEMERRLAELVPNDRHYIAVVDSGGPLLGWMHVEHRDSIESRDRAELIGLVVDARARRRGLGRALVGDAEEWTRERGLSTLMVRSIAARDVVPFYESLGYERDETLCAYSKDVGS